MLSTQHPVCSLGGPLPPLFAKAEQGSSALGQSTHHQQVVEEKHLPLMSGLLLQLVHIRHLEEPAAADQAAMGH